VLRAYCTTLHDTLDDSPRRLLRPYLVRTIGTSDDGFDEMRSWMAMDCMIHTYVPTWLTVAGLEGAAERLAALPAVTDASVLREALVALRGVGEETRAAWSAARGASRSAAWTPPTVELAAPWLVTGAASAMSGRSGRAAPGQKWPWSPSAEIRR
jgi:hypothetical protein